MTCACLEAGSSPVRVMATGPSVQRHSKAVGGGVKAGGAPLGLSPRAVRITTDETATTVPRPSSRTKRIADIDTTPIRIRTRIPGENYRVQANWRDGVWQGPRYARYGQGCTAALRWL